MEQHAVPQDITGFKFKLVGDMTLKQFGELAGGAIVAYIFYVSGLHPILKWPLVFTFGFLGFALAFLPIEERPLDIWLANFFKSIYQPTLYLWKKGASVALTFGAPAGSQTINRLPTPTVAAWPYGQEKKEEVKEPEQKPKDESAGPMAIEDLQRLRDQKIADLEKMTQRLKTVDIKLKTDTFAAAKKPGVITIDELARRRDDQKMADDAKLRELLEQNLKLGSQIEEVQTKIQALEGADTGQLKTQMDNLFKEKDQLTTTITALQNKVEGKTAQDQPPPPPAQEAQVRVVEKPVSRQTNITLTDIPNVINGVVTGDNGVPLDSTILTVKDKAGNAIRALKTNQIGQFIASTPLPNGIYYLEFERPNYIFETLEITLDGQVLAPIEIYGHH